MQSHGRYNNLAVESYDSLYLSLDVQEQHNHCKQQHCLKLKGVLPPSEFSHFLVRSYECAEAPKLKQE